MAVSVHAETLNHIPAHAETSAMTTICLHCRLALTPLQISKRRRFCSTICGAKSLGGAPHGYMEPGLEPTEHPNNTQIAWAAGIFEGEGSSNRSGSRSRRSRTERLMVSQKDLWLLERCRALFGGSIKRHGKISAWNLSGTRARGFLMTIYSFLSPRRKEQVRRTLGVVGDGFSISC